MILPRLKKCLLDHQARFISSLSIFSFKICFSFSELKNANRKLVYLREIGPYNKIEFFLKFNARTKASH